MKKPVFTKTVKRIALLNTLVMLGLYVLFIFFTLTIVKYVIVEDKDSRLSHEIEHVKNAFIIENDSLILKFPTELNEPDLTYITEHPLFLQIYDLKGNLIYQSKNLVYYDDILLGFPNKFDPYYYEDLKVGKDNLRIIYSQMKNSSNKPVGYFQLGSIYSNFGYVIKRILLFNLIAMPLTLLIIISLSIFLARKSYQPIHKIISLANNISATNLNERLTYEAEPNDELGMLKQTLNSLFERLESQVSEISHFTDNASHQLMTPLTAISSELDYVLKKERNINEYRDSLKILKTQTDRMISIVKTMLILARECQGCTDSQNVFELSTLINKNVSDLYKNQNVDFTVDKEIYLRGRPDYFSIVMQNLINNALKYSGRNHVKVSIVKNSDTAKILVEDHGIGISEVDKERIFERFYRGINGEGKGIEGYGLGLSLVKSVITSMGGDIKVEDNVPTGSKFIIILPLVKFN